MMRKTAIFQLALTALLSTLSASPAPAQTRTAQRLALVIGESHYREAPLAAAANDAGLIADLLQRAGFDVTGAADLGEENLRKSFRDFVDKAQAAGPDAVIFVYLAGRGVQYSGENFFIPVDADLTRPENIPLETLRLSDYLGPLAQTGRGPHVIVLDAARQGSFSDDGRLAAGLSLIDPPSNNLIAFNAAPGTVAPDDPGPYGLYAQALVEALRAPGQPVDLAFEQTRIRVAQQTQGAVVPWSVSRLAVRFALFPALSSAPAASFPVATLRERPIQDFSAEQGYFAALARDDFTAYQDYLVAFPNSLYAARVQAMMAMRREAMAWSRAVDHDTPEAFWTYLRFFPNGPHAEDARWRLAALHAQAVAPPNFVLFDYGAPPPPPEEAQYFHRHHGENFGDPAYGPPPPGILPPPAVLVEQAPPPPPHPGLLPLPEMTAPLVGAAVGAAAVGSALGHGALHAPAPVQAQYPGAQNFYDRAAPQVFSPGRPPTPVPPPAPTAPNANILLRPQVSAPGAQLPQQAAPNGNNPPHPAAPIPPALQPPPPGVNMAPAPAPTGSAAAPHPPAPHGDMSLRPPPVAPPAPLPPAPHPATPNGNMPPHPTPAAPSVPTPPAPHPAMPMPHMPAPQPIAPPPMPPHIVVPHPIAPLAPPHPIAPLAPPHQMAPMAQPHPIEPPRLIIPPPAPHPAEGPRPISPLRPPGLGEAHP